MPYIYSRDEQNQAQIWDSYAGKGYLQSTIDPRDTKGLKCDYIDRWSRYYINKFVLRDNGLIEVLEIGCGSGRNLFALSKHIKTGYGTDIASQQVANAKDKCRQLSLNNIHFYDDPDALFSQARNIRTVFTMWVLAGFESDRNLCKMLSAYLHNLPFARHFVFFEQVCRRPYAVYEKGHFYKKIRSFDDYVALFGDAGFSVIDFHIINEKGFGPFYRALYKTGIYAFWPKKLNLNKCLFALDRCFVHREIAETFTDCAFVCRV